MPARIRQSVVDSFFVHPNDAAQDLLHRRRRIVESLQGFQVDIWMAGMHQRIKGVQFLLSTGSPLRIFFEYWLGLEKIVQRLLHFDAVGSHIDSVR